jgi:hypothetical protein
MSWNETEILAARRMMRRAAQDMINGSLSFLEGAREIVAATMTARLHERDIDLLPFVGIVSETDALPIGPSRKDWQATALDALQPEIDLKEAWARKLAEPHCRSLVDRLSKDDPSICAAVASTIAQLRPTD